MKYIASWSGGKDSTASIILAHKHGEPLDLIIFSEVMFDAETSGELPEHIDFIKSRAIPVFENWGYKTVILRSDKNFMSCFNHVVTRSEKRAGMRQGFPIVGKCKINRDCKTDPIEKFLRHYPEAVTQYIGIAIDEPKRIKRVEKSKTQISLLQKYGYTGQMAFELCEQYNLLSPIYDFAKRGGCWFCPNARYNELKHLRTNHKDLWNKILELENETNMIGSMWNTLKGTRLHDWEERFYWEERQISIFDFWMKR